VKQKFGLDEGQLGLFLLTMPAGVTLMNPFSVPLLHRYGAVNVTLISLVLSTAFFALLFLMPQLWLTVALLFLAGATYSCLNVAMNTCAALLEAHEDLRIMSACHGLWSAGAMTGSAITALLSGNSLSPFACLLLLLLFELLVALAMKKPMSEVPGEQPAASREGADHPRTGLVIPNQPLWILISLSLCVNITEGTMTDWSVLYMQDVVEAPLYLAGWGFSVYAFFMASGRFLGDALLSRYDSKSVLRGGGSLVLAGLLLAVLFPHPAFALLGFALVGAGVSVGSPVLYSAAARVPGMAQGVGLATMNTFAMIGFMGGPALIGFIAKFFSLPTAFVVVACFSVFWIWRSGKLRE
jgi:MFS family permease